MHLDEANRFLASPSITRLPTGRLLLLYEKCASAFKDDLLGDLSYSSMYPRNLSQARQRMLARSVCASKLFTVPPNTGERATTA